MKRPGPGVKMAQAAHNPAIHFDRYPRRDPIYAAIHLHEKSPTPRASDPGARQAGLRPAHRGPLTSPRQAWSSTPSRPPSPASCEYIALAARPRPIRSKHFGSSLGRGMTTDKSTDDAVAPVTAAIEQSTDRLCARIARPPHAPWELEPRGAVYRGYVVDLARWRLSQRQNSD